MKAKILIASLILLQGCADMMTTTTVGSTPFSYVGVNCERAIKYSSNKIEISGIEVPMSVSGSANTIKVGELNLSQDNIREASDLIKSIDLLQYSTCQDMLLISSEENRMLLSQRKNNLVLLLTQTANKLKEAQSESEYEAVTDDAKNELKELTNG